MWEKFHKRFHTSKRPFVKNRSIFCKGEKKKNQVSLHSLPCRASCHGDLLSSQSARCCSSPSVSRTESRGSPVGSHWAGDTKCRSPRGLSSLPGMFQGEQELLSEFCLVGHSPGMAELLGGSREQKLAGKLLWGNIHLCQEGGTDQTLGAGAAGAAGEH